jgi:hypothetical protein
MDGTGVIVADLKSDQILKFKIKSTTNEGQSHLSPVITLTVEGCDVPIET